MARMYKVITPYGLMKRRTERIYTHVVVLVVKGEDGKEIPEKNYAVWAGNRSLAEQYARREEKWGRVAHIYEVPQDGMEKR